MNRLCTLLFVTALFTLSSVQAQVSHGTMNYDKKDQDALYLEVPFDTDIAEGTIEKLMTEKGYKKKTSKGVWVYKQAVIPSISPSPLDYLFRVERRGKKKVEDATVYLTVLNGAENRLSDNSIESSARYFLDELLPQMEQFKFDKDVSDQTANLDKEEKKLKKLVDDGDDMARKLKKLQDDIEDNEKKQKEQSETVEQQRAILEEIKSRGPQRSTENG